MLPSSRLAAIFLCGGLALAPTPALGQGQDPSALVRAIVKSELGADAQDHSRWMFRDSKKVADRSTVQLVVQTSQGDLYKTIEIDGHPLTTQQQEQDEQKIRRFVTDPSVLQKQKRDNQEDAKKAAALTEMLPDAFLWTKIGERGAEETLAFRPNPQFRPQTRQALVFAAMEGMMAVNTKQRRIQSLKGKLTKDVRFGLGLLGKLEKGGTFDVERQEISPGVWEITATHIHIHGHALIFKSISEQQDEETSEYTPAPQSITLTTAAKLLNDGTIAKRLQQSDRQ